VVNSHLLYLLSYRGSVIAFVCGACFYHHLTGMSRSIFIDRPQSMSDEKMEAGGGVEPPIGDLQSPALPLCYPATGLVVQHDLWRRTISGMTPSLVPNRQTVLMFQALPPAFPQSAAPLDGSGL
jgi:hypothetical protein